ncbi:MAG TPA: hypothetical protein VNU71_07295 [Burkholderiaceae bacterium]|nr:hypothetical protein [Burkholderiaceae bacterium]
MGISSISGVGRAATSTADTPAPAPTPRQGGADAPAPKVDEVTQQPLPPRFPWLSRLALQLESAAKQKHAFPPAPLLGDHVDKSA